MNSPFPNLPYLIDGSTVVTESDAIFFYLAQKAGRDDLFGSDFNEKLLVIQVRGVLKDVAAQLSDLIYSSNFNEKLTEECLKEDGFLRKKLNFLHIFLEGKNFLIGKNPTYLDFLFYESFQLIAKLDANLVAKYPNFSKHSENFRKLNGIENYMKSPRFEATKQFANPLHSISKV